MYTPAKIAQKPSILTGKENTSSSSRHASFGCVGRRAAGRVVLSQQSRERRTGGGGALQQHDLLGGVVEQLAVGPEAAWIEGHDVGMEPRGRGRS